MSADGMKLKAVPKPEGFDLRNARADREHDGSKWLPADALYDAHEEMAKVKVERAMLIAWWQRNEDGKVTLNYRSYAEHDQQNVALCSVLLSYLTAP